MQRRTHCRSDLVQRPEHCRVAATPECDTQTHSELHGGSGVWTLTKISECFDPSFHSSGVERQKGDGPYPTRANPRRKVHSGVGSVPFHFHSEDPLLNNTGYIPSTRALDASGGWRA
jgi:hypothetical protein